MSKSTLVLQSLLTSLRDAARARGLSDAQWAARAGVRAETLARLKGRETCDLDTLVRLAAVVQATVDLQWGSARPESTAARWPEAFSRDDEERLARFVAHGTLEPRAWLRQGPPYFMAGLATLVASLPGYERRRYLELAETLHTGITTPEVFEAWLRDGPVEPSRFVPMLSAEVAHAN